MATESVLHSVHPFGVGSVKPAVPDFDSLSKTTTSVDVGRLQTELRAFHNRLTLLETIATTSMKYEEERLDGGSENSGEEAIHCAGSNVDDLTIASADPSMAPSEQGSASAIVGCNEAGASVASKPDARCRNKAQSPKEKAAAIAKSMEIRQLQLAIEARVTSDDLMQATNANADKIAALQSSIECAISDNFRRVQDMVHSQIAGVQQTFQELVHDQSQSCKKWRNSFFMPQTSDATEGRSSPDGSYEAEEGSTAKETDGHEAFVNAVTEVVHRVISRAPKVDSANFNALKDDYEIFKEYMEEKAERQSTMETSLDDFDARLEVAEETISAVKDNMDSSSKEMEEAIQLMEQKQEDLEKIAQEASSLIAEANGECAVTRELIQEAKREVLLDARREAEAIVARSEGRAKADAQNMKAEARTATEKMMNELKRHTERAEDEVKGQNQVITEVKSLSDKAMASAVAGLELATEVEASLRRAEEHFGNHLHEATDKQAALVEGFSERLVMGEVELSKLKEELREFVETNGVNIGELRDDLANAKAFAETTTGILRGDVKDALQAMLLDQDLGGRRVTKNRKSFTGDGTSSIVCSDEDTPRVCELLSLGVALRRQEDDTVQSIARLQQSSVGIVTMLRKVQAGLQVLSTKDLFWKRGDTKLEAHQQAVENICLDVESSTVARRSRITLSKEAQACLAGDMLRVAKLIAVKADYEVIRDLAKLEGPDQNGQEWDDRVGYLRKLYTKRFVQACRDGLDKRAPELLMNIRGEEIRGKFLEKLSNALKIALSKYSPTTPGETLFGKIRLKAKACVACDRPFAPSGTGLMPNGGISGAAIEPHILPEENSHITKGSFRPQTLAGRLGSPSRQRPPIESFELHPSPIHSVVNGDRSSAGSPHVFRGGFKLPKHLKTPLQAIEAEDQGALGMRPKPHLQHKSPLINGLHPVPKDVRPRTSGNSQERGQSRMAAAPSCHPRLHAPHGGEDIGSTVVGAGGDRGMEDIPQREHETVTTMSDGAQKLII